MVSDENKEFILKVFYFTTIASASILFGFSRTVNRFSGDQQATKEAVLHEEAVALARKALMRGTIYSVGGFGLLATATYLLFGRKLINDFKEKHKTRDDDKDLIELQNLFK